MMNGHRNSLGRVARCAFVAGTTTLVASCGLNIPAPGSPGAVCNSRPNGCGPALFDILVPECPSPPACFEPACDSHDNCYRLCGIERAVCDNNFLMDMLASCEASYLSTSERYERCRSLAFVYATAVDQLGAEVFLGVQAIGCVCEAVGVRYTDTARVITPPGMTVADLMDCPYADADRDLLPDDWELSAGLDPSDPSDARHDNDGDGRNNISEFIFDSDPFSALGQQ